ncbi:MAG TPA: 4a-hydroxytetrahydrobiopterin dehydratase [Longimicrobiales bacterium]|nr:4a-hydroxytetrahydrobiopterin dehydratase [Longimicrobiales bacterium]
MPLLSDEEIAREMQSVPDWTREGDAIRRTAELSTFPAAIAFVNRVAEAAEEADHHPDIDIRYKKVRLELSTHSAGGLTGKDFALAQRIDHMLEDA